MNLKDKLNKFDFLQTASAVADEVGVEVYAVGGFIRDLILEKNLEDIDFLIVGDVMKYAQTLGFDFRNKRYCLSSKILEQHISLIRIEFRICCSKKRII